MPPQTAADVIAQAAARFFPSRNARLDAETLFRGVTGLSRASLLSLTNETVDAEAAARFETMVRRREGHEPIQYILGAAAFWRDEFIVNESVLIPRPDTEILIEVVAARLRDLPTANVLDMGTGSGCIALSLLRELERARALAVDISNAALQVARQNAARLQLESRAEFRVSRWFESIEPTETFDAIVSNPPYVAVTDAASLADEVRSFEPALALFAEPEDDLSSYRAILSGLGDRLKPSGLLAVEVGLGQAERVAQLLSENHFVSIEARNDLASIPRVVLGRRP